MQRKNRQTLSVNWHKKRGSIRMSDFWVDIGKLIEMRNALRKPSKRYLKRNSGRVRAENRDM